MDNRDRSNSGSLALDESSRRQNQIDQFKKQISGIGGVQLDDRTFQTQLLESGVRGFQCTAKELCIDDL